MRSLYLAPMEEGSKLRKNPKLQKDLSDFVKGIEKYLEIPRMERIRLEYDIRPYFDVIVRINSAKVANDLAAVSQGYEQLKALYHGTSVEEQVQHLDGNDLLAFSAKIPPLPTKINGVFSELTILGLGGIMTTVLGSTLFANSYMAEYLTAPGLLKAAVESSALFGGLYATQKILINDNYPLKTRIGAFSQTVLSYASDYCNSALKAVRLK